MIAIVVSLLASLLLLFWSAERFIDGSCALARSLGVSPLVIGMVVVGFGTSAPEMAVSGLAALDSNPGIAFGNIFGSNIANIGLILGVVACIAPLQVASGVLRREMPMLLAASFLALVLLWDGQLSRADAGLFALLFTALMVWSWREGKASPDDALSGEVSREIADTSMSLPRALIWTGVGLLVLVLVASSRVLVWSATEIARHFGVSELIIGLTIVAVGTSLPELASSLVAARKNEHDIALGNVIGSNLFNTLAITGLAGLIRPLPVDASLRMRDLPVTLLFTLLLFVFCVTIKGQANIGRGKGAVLLLAYIAYTGTLLIPH